MHSAPIALMDPGPSRCRAMTRRAPASALKATTRLNFEEEPQCALDADLGTLEAVHLHQRASKTPLRREVEQEPERVAEVRKDRVDEGLGCPFEVEDLRPAVGVRQEEVGHLLEAGDEAAEVARLIVAAGMGGQHRSQVEASPRGGRREAAEHRQVVERARERRGGGRRDLDVHIEAELELGR